MPIILPTDYDSTLALHSGDEDSATTPDAQIELTADDDDEIVPVTILRIDELLHELNSHQNLFAYGVSPEGILFKGVPKGRVNEKKFEGVKRLEGTEQYIFFIAYYTTPLSEKQIEDYNLIDLNALKDSLNTNSATQDTTADNLRADSQAIETATQLADALNSYVDVLRPAISDDDVNAIANMSKDDKSALKLKINQFDLRQILPLDRQGRGFICLVCGNGSGSTGDGIVPSIIIDKNGNEILLYHCFKCNKLNGDLFKIIYTLNNLDAKKDFNRILAIGQKIINSEPVNSNITFDTPKSEPLTPEQLAAVEKQIDTYFANIDDLPVEDRRALSIDTLKHFHCGYCDAFKLPFSDWDYISRRIIIPSTKNAYNAILPLRDRNVSNEKFKCLNVNGKAIFNADAITADKPVIVVEGEIDAMSIWQVTAGHPVIAIGGAGNINNFISLLKDKFSDTERKKLAFVIIFDNDDTGKNKAKDLSDALHNIDCRAFVDFIHDGKHKADANLVLTKYGDEKLNQRLQQILTDADYFFNNTPADETPSNEKRDCFKLSKEKIENMIFERNNDEGNALRFLKCYSGEGGVVQFIRSSEQWLVFSTPIWRISQNKTASIATEPFLKMASQAHKYSDAKIKNLNKEIADLINNSSEFTDEEKKRLLTGTANYSSEFTDEEKKRFEEITSQINIWEAFSSNMENLGNRKKYNPAIKTACDKALFYSTVTAEMINNYPHLLNTPSGIVDLTTGKVYPHSPKYFFTQCTTAEYRAGYRNETVEKFLRDILPDEETRFFLLDYSAYGLTGSVDKEKALIIYGGGSNGKGTFTKSLQTALGVGITGYATTVNSELILQSAFSRDANAPSPEKAKLEYKRLAVIEELPKNKKLDETEFKRLTGGDILPARFLNQNPREIYPQFKLLISGNFLPSIDDPDDYAITRRILICPFTQTFKEDRVNEKLKQELMKPDAQCGLLSHLVDRCVEWHKRGETLTPSAEMDAAKKKWLDSLRDNDCTDAALTLVVQKFFNDFCQHDPHGFILLKDFIAKFRQQYPNITISNKQENQIKEIVINHEDFKIAYMRSNKGMKFHGVNWK